MLLGKFRRHILVKNIKHKGVVFVLFFNILIFIILYFLYGKVDIKEPIAYDGDLLHNYFIIKSIVKNGWYMKNELLGNGTFSQYGFNYGNTLQFLIIKFIALFSDNVFLIFNIFYFYTYFAVANVCYYIMNKLNIGYKQAIVFSVLFAFAPFHQLRILGGVCFTDYSCIPVFCYLALNLMENGEKDVSTGSLIVAFITGLYHIYMPYFGCILLCIAMLYRLVNYDKECIIYDIKYFVKTLTAIVCGVIVNMLPSLWKTLCGENALVQRKPWQAESFSFKIIELFLPRMNHRVSKLAEISEAYMNRTGSHAEGMMSALGIVGSLGLICILFNLLSKRSGLLNRNAVIVVGMVLLGTQGGIGAIIAYMFPMVRAYARISFFISFFCFISFAYILSCIENKCTYIGKIILNCMLFVLLIIGVLDQTVVYTLDEQNEIVTNKNSDKAFVESISALYNLGGGWKNLADAI